MISCYPRYSAILRWFTILIIQTILIGLYMMERKEANLVPIAHGSISVKTLVFLMASHSKLTKQLSVVNYKTLDFDTIFKI